MDDSGNGGLITATIIHYGFSGRRLAQAVNGAFSYLGLNGLGSASVALDGSGNVQASVLYGPYGAVRYSSGTMPGSSGYTGQHADATTGLDYYNARYYDASAGQFASADTVADGLNRYGYVHGNPTTATDPTGHGAGQCIIVDGVYYCPPQPPAPPVTPPPPGNGGGGDGGRNHSTCRGNANPVVRPECSAWYLWAHGLTDDTSTCDPTNNGAMCIRARALDDLRHSGIGWAVSGLIAVFVGIILAVSKGVDFGKIFSILVEGLNVAVDVIGILSTLDASRAETYQSLISTALFFVGALDTAIATLSGLAAWMVWTLRGGFIALKLSTLGVFNALLALGASIGGFLLQAAGTFAISHAYDIARDASAQGSMPIWDWCGPNGPGAGQCPTEPNGGMPIF